MSMRKRMKYLIALIVLSVTTPWLCGFFFEHSFYQLVSEYNQQDHFFITIQQYHRGWFVSKVEAQVEVVSPLAKRYWSTLRQRYPELPETIFFNVKERIYHGPFIYHRASMLPSIFGLASAYTVISFSDPIEHAIRLLDKSEQSWQTSDDLITFRGNYYRHFVISPFEFEIAGMKVKGSVSQPIEGSTWVTLSQNSFSGKVVLPEIVIKKENEIVQGSHITLSFNQSQSKSQLWIGTFSMGASDVSIKEGIGQPIVIQGFKTTGTLDEASGLLHGVRRIHIRSLQIEDKKIGPLFLELSLNDVSAEGIAKTLNSIFDIYIEGEYYKSQLQKTFLLLFPRMITPGSMIKLDRLSVALPEGRFEMQAKMKWPHQDFLAPSNMQEFFDYGVLRATLKSDKSFVQEAIRLLSVMPHFFLNQEDLYERWQNLQEVIQGARQRQLLSINQLRETNELSDLAVTVLGNQFQEGVSFSTYAETVKHLFLLREMSRSASYMLVYQAFQTNQFEGMANRFKEEIGDSLKKVLQADLNQWIQSGYLVVKGNQYFSTITREAGVLKVNGKEIGSEK